jgi:hypothetical protein
VTTIFGGHSLLLPIGYNISTDVVWFLLFKTTSSLRSNVFKNLREALVLDLVLHILRLSILDSSKIKK